MATHCTRSIEADKHSDLSAVIGLSEPLLVSGVGLDSRDLSQGYAFVALAGAACHGLSFVEQARENGAIVTLLDANDPLSVERHGSGQLSVPSILVPDLRSKLGVIARAVYGNVDQKLSLVGVTGTDGKTSITHFVAQLLGLSGKSCAVLGTVGNGLLSDLRASSHTTGDVFQVYRQLAILQAEGVEIVAMEVSSHALHQERVSGLNFEVAVLSNLGSDHLDYHGDIESYAEAKALLFDRRARVCVLNTDDAFGQKLLAQIPAATGYSVSAKEEARWTAEACEYLDDGICCQIGVPELQCKVLLPVLGAFNVSNILASCAVAEALGESVKSIVEHLPQLESVVGRADLLLSTKGPRVVIDYAHTAQALSAILGTLRDHFSARIWCVFGCGGDRDRSKRSEMTRAVMALADCLVVTSDNPRSEDPQQIIEDMLWTINTAAEVHVEVDRAAAIVFALDNAASGDCVLIAGKGHENYQILSDRTVAFSDRAEVLAWLGEAA